MTLKAYLRDEAGSLGIAAGVFLLMLLFLTAFRAPGALIVFILVPYTAGALTILLWNFHRRRSFYDRLFANLADLDQKYLAAEVVPEPSFYEGRLFYEAAYEMGKSMAERVAENRRSLADFREYIELWVHEVKLPIASLMLGFYNGGFGGADRGFGRMTRSQAAEQLRRLDAYTEQVLYYSRSETAEKDFLIKEVRLRKVVGDAMMKFRGELLAKEFSISTEGLDCSVLSDGKWLEFILGQLISNSLKYCAENGERTLSFRAKPTEKGTAFLVRDNGIGIPKVDLPRIFDKTFTGENGRMRAKSTGMGLFIARKLCGKLGHSISVSSEQGSYTEFQILFTGSDYYRPAQ